MGRGNGREVAELFRSVNYDNLPRSINLDISIIKERLLSCVFVLSIMFVGFIDSVYSSFFHCLQVELIDTCWNLNTKKMIHLDLHNPTDPSMDRFKERVTGNHGVFSTFAPCVCFQWNGIVIILGVPFIVGEPFSMVPVWLDTHTHTIPGKPAKQWVCLKERLLSKIQKIQLDIILSPKVWP